MCTYQAVVRGDPDGEYLGAIRFHTGSERMERVGLHGGSSRGGRFEQFMEHVRNNMVAGNHVELSVLPCDALRDRIMFKITPCKPTLGLPEDEDHKAYEGDSEAL